MNAALLANAAERAAQKLAGVLSAELQRQVALAHIAMWIGQQDESISDTAVRATATKATEKINERYMNEG